MSDETMTQAETIKASALVRLQNARTKEGMTLFDLVVKTPPELLAIGGLLIMRTGQAFSGIWMDQTLDEHIDFALGSPIASTGTTPSEATP
jgi:hypothetical protein